MKGETIACSLCRNSDWTGCRPGCGKAATKTGHVVKHATKKVGKGTKTGVKDVGHGAKVAAKDTGKGVKVTK
jgi:hypothetical protein